MYFDASFHYQTSQFEYIRLIVLTILRHRPHHPPRDRSVASWWHYHQALLRTEAVCTRIYEHNPHI